MVGNKLPTIVKAIPLRYIEACEPIGLHKRRMIVVLQAYFDESGTHEASDIVLIAGFVADSSIWAEIQNDWRRQLEVSRVEYFHAVECENGEGIYQRLSRGIRDSLFNGVSGVIAKHKPMSVSAAVMRSDWNKFKTGIIGETFGDPYNLCFEFCMQKISAWSKDEAQGEAVALIFAEQKEFKERADKIYELYRNNSRWGNELAFYLLRPRLNARLFKLPI